MRQALIAQSPIGADEARAAARQEPYDQLMALYPARGGHDASIRIYNNDGSEAGACGNGMRCVASLIGAETGKATLNFETSAGLVSCWSAGGGMFTVDMGAPRFRWNEIPLAKEMPDTRAIDLQFGPPAAPILRAPSAVSMGNPHAIFWVEDPQAYDLAAIGPVLERDPLFPRTRQYHAGGDALARPGGDPDLGTRRRSHQGLRFGGLCRSRRRGAARPNRPEGDSQRARRRPHDRMARKRRPRVDDGTG